MNKKIFLSVVLLAIILGIFIGEQLNKALRISISSKKFNFVEKEKTHSRKFSSLSLRMVDLGGVGIAVNPATWGNDYSHNPRRFEKVFLRQKPFVNETEYNKMYKEFQLYIDKMKGLGFNAIEMAGFLDFITFQHVENGEAIYPMKSVYRERYAALRPYYQKLFHYANQQGFQIFLRTDMVAVNSAIKKYFHQKLGGMHVDKDEFWSVYQKGLEELFQNYPQLSGLVIRVGEAGAVYNIAGSDAGSELLVRTPASLNKMLSAFLVVAKQHKKYIIFRTWSVGVGEIGHMHTNPKVYHKALSSIQSEYLIVSTKFCQGDYWSHLPPNPTLLKGQHKRIIEFQARREFETFNVVPNYVAFLHHYALVEFLQHNPKIYGAWVWTQHGGPLRHGPAMTYPFHGMWLWNDANVYATAKMLQYPNQPVNRWTKEWTTKIFGENQEVQETINDILTQSHRITACGLTVPFFARKYVKGMGLEIPPVIYCYWDFIDSSTSVASHLYYVSKENISLAIKESFDVAQQVTQMRKKFTAIEGKISKGKEWVPLILQSLEYQENLLQTLAYHKEFLLKFYQWVDQGKDSQKSDWQNAQKKYLQARKKHEQKYKNNINFPAYNFVFADIGCHQAGRSVMVQWFSRIFFIVIMLLSYFLFSSLQHSIWRSYFFYLAFFILVTASFLSFNAPILLMSITAILVFYLWGISFIQKNPKLYFWTTFPLFVLGFLFVLFLSIRGPFYFWLNFWTSNFFRILLITIQLTFFAVHIYLLISFARKTTTVKTIFARLFLIIGSIITLIGSVMHTFTLETVLSRLNDEILLIPGITSRVLGITTHMNIPTTIPFYLTITGSTVVIAGMFLLLLRKNKMH